MARRRQSPGDGSEANPGPQLPEWKETTIVGRRLPRIDAHQRASGTATFSADVALPGMLHAAILRCPHAHARVRRVDTSRARSMPGVRALLTDNDPEARIPWYFTFKGEPQSRLFDPHCRFAGEEVAAVAADTPYQAHDAVRAIQVEYEVLPFVIDVDEALKPGAPAVHDTGNLVAPIRYQRGDLQKGFAEADAIVEETYRTSCEIHTPIEVHGSVADWDASLLTVWDTTQSVFDVQQSLARLLGLPLSGVRVISSYMGGGFGSKLEAGKYTVIAALLSRKTGRPVKLFLTREDSFLAVGNRPAQIIALKAGARRDGTLTALDMSSRASVGAYETVSVIGGQVQNLYLCPNVRTEDISVYTNTGQLRAFRAPGFPPCSWALEQTIDALAEEIGMDPVALRLKNIPSVHQSRNVPYTSTGLARCLAEGADAFGWRQARSRPRREGPVLRGVGVAAAMWGYAGEPISTVIAKLFADGSLNLTFGAADIGTGTKTVLAMVAAEELGVPLERIRVEHADSATSPYAVASGGSQTVLVNAPAVREAAAALKKQLLDMAATQLKVAPSDLTMAGSEVVSKSTPQVKVAVADLKGLQEQRVLLGIGHRAPLPEGKVALPFAAQFAEVEVNARTGEVRVLRLLGAHDSGRVMNLATYENQVFGGMTMGVGYAMMEQRVVDRPTGRVVNTNWHDYKVPTALDVPADFSCLPIDPHDTECNSVGAKGLGEPATIPTAAAVANAVYHACGVRVKEMPMDPAHLVQMLGNRG